MDNQNEKLSRFKTAVYSEVTQRAEKIVSDANAKCEKIIADSALTSQQKITAEISSYNSQSEARLTRALSSAQLDAKKQLLIYREKLVDDMFDKIKTKLTAFTSSEKYAEYLCEKATIAKNKYPSKQGCCLVRDEDMRFSNAIKTACGYDVQKCDCIEIGGLSVKYEEDGILLDFTLDSQLEEQRVGFSEKYRQALK